MSEEELRTVIHDLNNAFARILSAAELIGQEEGASEQTVSDARDIRAAALAGRELVERLRHGIRE